MRSVGLFCTISQQMLQNFSRNSSNRHAKYLPTMGFGRTIKNKLTPTIKGDTMKKLSVLALAMITATAANASIYDTPTNAGQWYWQADLGYSELDFDFGESNRTEDGVGGRISIGKDKGNYRYAYDYSYFGNAEDNYYYRDGTAYIHDEYNVYAHSSVPAPFMTLRTQAS